MFAIRDRITGQWLYGTDYGQYTRVQRISNNQAATFDSLEEAEAEYSLRECNAEYEIVKVELRVVEEGMEYDRLYPMSPLAKLLKDNPNMKLPLIKE